MQTNDSFQSIKQVFLNKKGPKAPAYEWQDLALKIISELRAPNFKRSAVFKVCKQLSKQQINQCLTDTKELCQTGEAWKYFFKLTDQLLYPDKPVTFSAAKKSPKEAEQN